MAADRERMPIQTALEWAFGIENAQLELPDKRAIEDRGFGFGTEYTIMQRLKLGGVKIEGGGYSDPHDDADIIASVVSTIPQKLGGAGMAIYVAQNARCMIEPDWMPMAHPKITAREWRKNQTGRSAKTEVIRQYNEKILTPHPKNPARTITRTVKRVEEFCPITYDPSPQEIDSARAEYTLWRSALGYVRDELFGSDMLSKIEITTRLPVANPWKHQPAGDGLSANLPPAPQTPAGR